MTERIIKMYQKDIDEADSLIFKGYEKVMVLKEEGDIKGVGIVMKAIKALEAQKKNFEQGIRKLKKI